MGKRTTTSRHKNDNTFKFEKFEDKLRKLNVSISSNIRDGRFYKPDEHETYFYQAIEKCCGLHTTEAFEKLLNEIGIEAKTLTQVLHQKDHISSVLQAHLTPENRSSFAPTLDLVVALARDLEKEFYPDLIKFIKLIIQVVVTSKDSEEIEKGFQCFAYLFKFLRTFVVKDFPKILKHFVPLLRPNQKKYVTIFACESFEMVASKVAKNSPANFLQSTFQFIKKDTSITTGIGGLLFYMMKGQAKSLRDYSLQFSDCLNFISTLDCEEDRLLWVETLRTLVENLAGHLDKDKTSVLWTALEDHLKKAQESQQVQLFENIFQIYKYMIQYSGDNIFEIQQRINVLTSLSTGSETMLTPLVLQILTEIIEILIKLNGNDYRVAEDINSVIVKLFEKNSKELLEKLNEILSLTPWFFLKYLLPLSRGFHRVIDNESEKLKTFIRLSSSSLLISSKDVYLPQLESKYFHGFSTPAIIFKSKGRRFKTFGINKAELQKHLNWNCCEQFDEIFKLIEQSSWRNEENFEYILRFLLIFPRIQEIDCDDCCKKILDTISLLSDSYSNHPENSKADLLIYQLVEISALKGFLFQSNNGNLQELLKAMSKSINFYDNNESGSKFSLWMLKALDLILFSFGKFNSTIEESRVAHLKNSLYELVNLSKSNLFCGFKIIRVISVSIQSQKEMLEGSGDALLAEFYKNVIDLEENDPISIDYPSKAKALFNRVPVLLKHPDCTVALKEIFLSYIFGFMYVNNNQVWTECIKTAVLIANDENNFDSFWKLFQKAFKIFYDETVITDSILSSTERDSADFVKKLEICTFGLPASERGSSEFEERLDYSQYKGNLWKILNHIPQQSWKASSPELLKIIKTFLSDLVIEDFGMKVDTDTRDNTKTLIPILKYLTHINDSRLNIELWDLCLHLLISPQNIRTEVLNVVLGLRRSQLNTYRESILSLNTPSATDSLLEFGIDTEGEEEPLIKDVHRETVISVVIRLLIGREKFSKKGKVDAVIRFISSCTEKEALEFLNLYIGRDLVHWKDIGYKYLEVRLYRITNIITIWKYTFPHLSLDLMKRTLGITKFILGSTPDEENDELKKRAIKASKITLVTFFELYQKLDFGSEDFLRNLFDVFIWPELETLYDTSTGGVNWLLKLFNIWSLNKRFHPLLAYSDIKYPNQTPADSLIKLISNPKSLYAVKKHVLEIFSNLVIEDFEVDDDEDMEIDDKDVVPLPLSIPESSGYEIIRSRKKEIFTILEEKMFFRKFCYDNSSSRKCLELITKLVDEDDESEWSEKIALILIENIQSFKKDEESLIECLSTVKKLLIVVENPKNILLKLGYCFTWAKGRRLRKALCEILDSQKDPVLRSIIQGVNSYSEKNFENPDFTRRGQSFSAIKSEIQSSTCQFDPVLYTLVAYNCFYYLLEEPDFAMRNIAINILEEISVKLGQVVVEDQKTLHQFIETVILTRLKGGIRHKDERKFQDFLRVLSYFIKNSSSIHGTLRELKSVFFSDDNVELNILEGLRDVKMHKRTRAMNSLTKRLESPDFHTSPAILMGYVFPLANQNLLDEEKLGQQKNELIDSSITVIKAILLQVPFEHYSKFLINLLDDPKKNTRISKQFERILIATMDSFHFDLSLGTNMMNVKDKDKVEAMQIEELEKQEKAIETTVNDNDNDYGENELDLEEKIEIRKYCTAGPLSRKNANSALRQLRNIIIPKLKKYLNFEEKATHKLSRSNNQVDEDVILKIPCTLALVKLLKKLPNKESSDAIRSIIPCLCSGLKSKLHSVREALKKTLLNVIKELGIQKFPVTVHFLKASLQRGYQKHVLHNTIYYLVRYLEKELLDSPHSFPIVDIINLCEDERFGVMNEEKDISEIREKTQEARVDNATPLLKFCGMFVFESKLDSLLKPVIKQFELKKSSETAKKGRQWFLSIIEGLALNQQLHPNFVMNWVEKLLKEYFPLKDESIVEKIVPKSKYLLPQANAKEIDWIDKKVSISENKNVMQFLITELSFSCLHFILKRGINLEELTGYIDKFIPYLSTGLETSSKFVNIISMKNFLLLLDLNLESFNDNGKRESIWKSVFITMNKHCYKSSSDIDMINSTFKFMSTFCNRFTTFKLTKSDFDLILRCVNMYLTKDNCSSSALFLLKGILRNKLKSQELESLMEEIGNQIVLSPYKHVNEGCRQVYLEYLKIYCTTPKSFRANLEFFINQLNYENFEGRLSAIEMVNSIIEITPESIYEDVRIVFFIKIMFALDIEVIEECRKKLSGGLELLFQKPDPEQEMFKTLISLLEDKSHIRSLKTLCLVAGIMIEHGDFWKEKSFLKMLKCLNNILEPKSLEQLSEECGESVTEKERDHALFMALTSIKKAISRKSFGPITNPSHLAYKTMLKIFGKIRENYLKYEHEWVLHISLVTSQLCLMENKLDYQSWAEQIESEKNKKSSKHFIGDKDELLELIKCFIGITRTATNDKIRDAGLSGITLLLPITARLQDITVIDESINVLRIMVNIEVRKNPQSSAHRLIVMYVYGHLIENSPEDAIKRISKSIIRILIREISDSGSPAPVKKLAEEVSELLRNKIGDDCFNTLYSEYTDELAQKRLGNRAKKREQAVLNPGKVRKRKSVPKFKDKKRFKSF